jgi:hypothetical protein
MTEPVRPDLKSAFTYERGFVDGQRRGEEARRDMREILRAWGLGDADKMAALMLGAFLREFGKAPKVRHDA